MNREFITFIIFLLINVSLSIHCLVYSYAGKKASIAKEEIKYTKDIEINEKQTLKISSIRSVKIHSEYLVQFTLENGEMLCLNLMTTFIEQYDYSYLYTCYDSLPDTSNESLWLAESDVKFRNAFIRSEQLIVNSSFPNNLILSKDKRFIYIHEINPISNKLSYKSFYGVGDKEYKKYLSPENNLTLNKFNTALYVYSVVKDISYIFLFKRSNVNKMELFKLSWDSKTNYEKKSDFKFVFWTIMQPIGIIIDTITFPIQVVGFYILYIMFDLR